jgi:membrane-associated protease RseP (regulator of RpoE activity)
MVTGTGLDTAYLRVVAIIRREAAMTEDNKSRSATIAVVTGIVALFLGLCLGAMFGGLSGYLVGRSTAPKAAPVIRPTRTSLTPQRVSPTPTPRGARPDAVPTPAPSGPRSGGGNLPQAGALIQEVIEGSPAAEANLRRNDVITQVEDTPIDADHRLADVVSQYQPGDTVSFTVWRGGNTSVVKVTVGAHPDDSKRAYLGVRYSDIVPQQGTPQPSD